MRISWETLYQLTESELYQAGLKREHVATVAGILVYADARGIHLRGAVRVEYYAERASKGDTNHEPGFRLEEAGPCSTILRVDNAAEQTAAKMGTEHTVKIAQQDGVTVAGISRVGHSNTVSYLVQQTTRTGFVGISMCQSDPIVMSFGGAEIYYDTNPLAFATPGESDEILTFDMATTAQIWGKVLDAHSRSMSIPDIQAVDKNDVPTTGPSAVHALLPAARSKGYGLMITTDVLSGVLLDLPFGRQISSMCDDLHVGCNLGQLRIVINPNFLFSSELFRQHLSQTMRELNAITPAPGFNQAYCPGQDQDIKQRKAVAEGIGIVDDIYQYLISGALYNTSYETKDPFA